MSVNQPQWQRCRYLKDGPVLPRGVEFWVRATAPRERLSVAYGTPSAEVPELAKPRRTYVTNLRASIHGAAGVGVGVESVELLARGPEDFADHVEPMTIDEVIAIQITFVAGGVLQ